jgi:glutathione S-transferase
MSLKLYFAPGACSFVPHSLLETAGAAYEPVMVKLHKGEQNEPAYRAINPRGQVPVLVDGDQTITQIVAIVTWLDAKFPEQRFLPREPLARTRVLETLSWMNNTVHPTFTHVFMPFKHFIDHKIDELVNEDEKLRSARMLIEWWSSASRFVSRCAPARSSRRSSRKSIAPLRLSCSRRRISSSMRAC